MRAQVVREDALACDRPRAAFPGADASDDVRRRDVEVVGVVDGIRRRRSGRERLRLETGQISGNDVARVVVSGPASQTWGPRFVVPRDDGAARVHTDTLIDR